jgi:PleD family two-component response regulator
VNLSGTRILIVDDEPKIRRAVKRSLAQMGLDAEVREAEGGEEALAMIPRFRPDVVLLDVMMPRVDGYEVCRAVKEDPETARSYVIMFSAMASAHDQQAGLEYGADVYLPKPATPELIQLHVRRGLKSAREAAAAADAAAEDPSTGLLTWSTFQSVYRREMAHAARANYEVVLALIHLRGVREMSREEPDRAAGLADEFGRLLASRIRESDWGFRHGLELFGVLFPETSPTLAVSVAENLASSAGDLVQGSGLAANAGLASVRGIDRAGLLQWAKDALKAAMREGAGAVRLREAEGAGTARA